MTDEGIIQAEIVEIGLKAGRKRQTDGIFAA